MKRCILILLSILVLGFLSCAKEERDFTELVNVFIGTAGDGNTYPGASVPFGMVQLSPDTRTEGSHSYGGYYYPDSAILGFSHTHLNGVGEPEMRDVLFMPFIDGDKQALLSQKGVSYHHENETGEPGYYSVIFDNGLNAELTVTGRCGFHRYSFPINETPNVFIDLTHPGGAEDLYIRKVSDCKVEGMRRSHGWAYDQYVYFVAEFSLAIKEFLVSVNNEGFVLSNGDGARDLQAILRFEPGNPDLLIKVGISAVSAEGARKNLSNEIGDWNFNAIKKQAKEKWNSKLAKIEIEGGSKDQQTVFYTSMYHAFLSPDLYQDVDSLYRGIDGNIHRAADFTNYTTFSLWDTYRALHPLFTILEPEMSNEFIKSLLAKYDDGGRLPMWPLLGNYTDDMLAYHAVSVISDAYIKGINDFDTVRAFEAMKKSAEFDKSGLGLYKELGYIPFDREAESASKTLEYCYDDWCISQFAKKMGLVKDYNVYQKRGQYYKALFDTGSNFFRGKGRDRNWIEPFDPLENSVYSEGNAYQYLYAPHDMDGLLELMGGVGELSSFLDTLFTVETENDPSNSLGQYWHGNEPGHHLPYLYTYCGEAWKTQHYVNRILNELYSNSPGGLAGNEDCGQMSAWYIMSSLGFYPLAPGQDIYVTGTPLFNRARINLENGKQFIVEAKNRSDENIYIQSATLNGEKYNKSFIKHGDIVKGGKLVFEMGSKPDKYWGSDKSERPYSNNGKKIVSNPYIENGEKLFLKSTKVKLSCDTENVNIYYTLDGSSPNLYSDIYTRAIVISESTSLKMMAAGQGLLSSSELELNFVKAHYQKATEVQNLRPGIAYKYYEKFFVTSLDLAQETPVDTGIMDAFTIDYAKKENYFGYSFEGYIRIDKDDIYTFYLRSNDGSRLFINENEIIENDGNHASVEKRAKVALKAGYHKVEVNYMQCGGGKELEVSWEASEFSKQEISKAHLFIEN